VSGHRVSGHRVSGQLAVGPPVGEPPVGPAAGELAVGESPVEPLVGEPSAGQPPIGRPSNELRDWLAPLADTLIPAGDGMPAAGQLGATFAQLDLVLDARPDLLRHLGRAHALTSGMSPALALTTLAELDPTAHGALLEVVAGGYYAHPEVRDLLGYAGQRPVPVRVADFPEYLADGLLERVVERGPIYRAAD
jgi:hypothetical protein